MVIFECTIAAKSFGCKAEMEVLTPLSRIAAVIVGLYFFLKVGDLTIRNAWGHIVDGTYQSNFFLLEFIVGIVVPFGMLLFRKIRRSSTGLFTAATLYILFGVLLNRVNVFFIAYRPKYATQAYVPAIGEFAVTIGLIAALMICYRIIVTIFPILPLHAKES